MNRKKQLNNPWESWGEEPASPHGNAHAPKSPKPFSDIAPPEPAGHVTHSTRPVRRSRLLGVRERFMHEYQRMRSGEWTTEQWLRLIWKSLFGFLIVFCIGIIGVLTFVFFVAQDLPTAEQLINFRAVESTKIFDRSGILLYEIHGDQRRTNVALKDISPYVINATLAAEDDNFYNHPGFDWKGIIRAATRDVLSMILGGSGSVQGASTITQQFVRNAYLTRDKTITRKVKELLLAMQVENHFTKDQILEMYLNTVSYGSNVYGVQTAAKTYFLKDAKDLTLAEGAVLAAMVQRPSYYSPYGSHLEDLIGRKDGYVLKRMKELGMITDEEMTAAKDTKLTFAPYHEAIRAPHFVFYVRDVLEEKYGKELVEEGGLQVYTTLDVGMQDIAERVITEQAEKNEKQYQAKNLALVSMNPKNGDILTMVGSRDYFNEEIDGQVNMVTAERQPGSSFKPIVYANAFVKGFGPGSVVYDVKTNFGNYEPENYDGKTRGPVTLRYALGQSLNIPAVKVFHLGGANAALDLANKMGLSTVHKEQEESLGLSAALGVAEVRPIDMAVAYSVFALGGKQASSRAVLRVEDRYGNILEEVPGYLPPEPVVTGSGAEVADPTATSTEPAVAEKPTPKKFPSLHELIPTEAELALRPQILDPEAAYLVTNILTDESVKLSTNLVLSGRPVATKTGTANKKNQKNVNVPSDVWTIGYTPSLVTVVWAGNSDATALNPYADGVNVAAPTWKGFMSEVLKNEPKEEFVRPEGIKSVATSKISGLLPSPQTPAAFIKEDLWPSYGIPKLTDQAVISAEVDALSGRLATQFTPDYARVTYVYQDDHSILYYLNKEDPQFSRWEPPVREWSRRHLEEMMQAVPTEPVSPDHIPGEVIIDGKRYKYVSSPDLIPTEYDDVHDETTDQNAPRVTILRPAEGDRLAPGDNTISLEVSGDNIDRVEVYFDTLLLDVLSNGRYEEAHIFVPNDIEIGSSHRLMVYVYNRMQERGYALSNITIASDAMPPELNLRSPRDEHRYNQGETIHFEADITDDRSGVREVEFLLDGRPVKLFTGSGPYQYDYEIPADMTIGLHNVVVRAFDNESNVSRVDRNVIVEEATR